MFPREFNNNYTLRYSHTDTHTHTHTRVRVSSCLTAHTRTNNFISNMSLSNAILMHLTDNCRNKNNTTTTTNNVIRPISLISWQRGSTLDINVVSCDCL